jgi:hypothetical protein
MGFVCLKFECLKNEFEKKNLKRKKRKILSSPSLSLPLSSILSARIQSRPAGLFLFPFLAPATAQRPNSTILPAQHCPFSFSFCAGR